MDEPLDLTALRLMWEARRTAAEAMRRRLVLRGPRRPARDPEELAWLRERGEDPFIQDEVAGQAAQAYYSRKYTRPSE